MLRDAEKLRSENGYNVKRRKVKRGIENFEFNYLERECQKKGHMPGNVEWKIIFELSMESNDVNSVLCLMPDLERN